MLKLRGNDFETPYNIPSITSTAPSFNIKSYGLLKSFKKEKKKKPGM
jgi:hypothetical protein